MTRYKTITHGSPYLPGLREPGDEVLVFNFRPKPRTYKQRCIKIGRWTLPLGRWHTTNNT